MTPLLTLEASTPRGGAAVAASDETVPKGDGEFADLVDAPATQDAQSPAPTDDKSPTADAVEDDLNPDLVAAQPDIPLLSKQAVGAAPLESPKSVAAKPPEHATEAVKLSPQTDVPPEESSLDGKVSLQQDKTVLTAKSAAQAIMEGRMPQSSMATDMKPVPLQQDTVTVGLMRGEKDPAAITPAQVDPNQSAITKGMQAPIGEQVVAVPAEPKSVRDAERHLSSTDQTQLPADITKSPSGPPTVAASAPVLTAAPTVMLDLQKKAANQSMAEVEAVSGLSTGERAGISNTQVVTASTSPIAAQTGQQAAHQIASAITLHGGRATEIALNPEELGRVRLSMTVHDATITLNVLAERPETTDLLRRNIDALAQEFRALGYDDINFSFGGDGAAQADTDETADQGTSSAEATDDLATPIAHQPTSGLDLRL